VKGNERVGIFIIGVLIGCVLVSVLVGRREAFKEASDVSWTGPGIEFEGPPLPDAVEPVLQEGRLLYHSVSPEESVWVVGFTDRYPFVRVVWDAETDTFEYMAADQVVIQMRDGVDVAALKPALDKLGVRIRMFNRRENVAVIGTVNSGASAVPDTLVALEPYAELFLHASPDPIRFREGERQGLFFSR
jgi:hypothetical protein